MRTQLLVSRMQNRHESVYIGWKKFSLEPPPSEPPCTVEQVKQELLHLPSGIRELRIRYTEVDEISALENSIKFLEITHCPRLHHIQQLPSCLQICRLYDLGRITLPSLPASLLELYIYNSEVIHSVTQLPPQLRVLILHNDSSDITVLPPLPITLTALTLQNTNIVKLPPSLPPSLRTFILFYTNITTLPPLPASLGLFAIMDSPITVLPPLPSTLDLLVYPPSQLLIQKESTEFIVDYEARWVPIRERIAEEESKVRCVSRCRAVKEALIERTWRPDWMMTWCLDEEEKAEWRIHDV